jgi:hypothetical protein
MRIKTLRMERRRGDEKSELQGEEEEMRIKRLRIEG